VAGVLLSTTASAVDIADCVYDGTFIYCAINRDFVTWANTRPTSL
jgi:hypothetical protein